MNLPGAPPLYNESDQRRLRAQLTEADKQNWKRGEDIYLLNGEKLWVATAPGGESLVTILAGLTDPTIPPTFVDTTAAGYTVRCTLGGVVATVADGTIFFGSHSNDAPSGWRLRFWHANATRFDYGNADAATVYYISNPATPWVFGRSAAQPYKMWFPRGLIIGAAADSYGRHINIGPTGALSGPYAVGDLTFESAPVPGGHIGVVCTTAGTTGTQLRFGNSVLENTATYDPPSIAVGAVDALQTMTVTGAALGDLVDVSFSLDLAGIFLRAYVSAANTVKYQFLNPAGSAGAVDLASGTVKCRIRK